MGAVGARVCESVRTSDGVKRAWHDVAIGSSPVEETEMASDKVKTFTDTNFETETKNGVVLVDFWAEWCGPCRRIAPIVEELASDYEGKATIGKMNVDENPNIPTSRFQVRGIPTLVVLKNGELVDTIVGLAPKEDIKKLIDRHLA
jgi:thioredoxin 1